LIAMSMMGQWQVEVDVAQNGEEAVAKSLQRKYDVVLMDIQMPEMDGTEATALLRAEGNPNAQTPVIALTADAVRFNQETTKDLGFSGFLNKPYSELALYKILARVSRRAEIDESNAEGGIGASELGLHYDFRLLGKLADDTTFVRKMLQMFIERVPVQVQTLLDAVARNDHDTVRREAHVLKSTFGTLNIQPEVNNLKVIEELAQAHAPASEILPLATAVSKATQLFLNLFAEDLAKLPPPEA
jgi:CheY-like chemotaxis protein